MGGEPVLHHGVQPDGCLYLEKEGANWQEVRLQAMLKRAVGAGAGASEPAAADRDLLRIMRAGTTTLLGCFTLARPASRRDMAHHHLSGYCCIEEAWHATRLLSLNGTSAGVSA